MCNCSSCQYWQTDKYCIKRGCRVLYASDCAYYEKRIDKMTEKRFTVKQRQGATIYSIEDYYGELPLSEGMYYKSNAEKLCKWLNTQHDLLNAFCKENEQLQARNDRQANQLYEENEQLKTKIDTLIQGNHTIQSRLKTVHEENEQLQARNDRQAKQLDNLYRLIEEKDWRTLSDILDDFKRCEEQLQREWGVYE